jgi:hypothetical protein
VEQLAASPVSYTKRTQDSAPVFPGTTLQNNALIDELGAEWVDELGNAMVAQ